MTLRYRSASFSSIVRSHAIALALILPATALLACAGQVVIDDGPDVGGSSASTVGHGVTTTTTTTSSVSPTTGTGESCSAQTVSQGAQCFINNDTCHFGWGSCTYNYVCVNDIWVETGEVCEGANGPDCTNANWNQACANEGDVCPMETGCGPCSITCTNGIWSTTPGQCVFEPTC